MTRVLAAALTAVFVLFLNTQAGRLEGYLFPVVTPAALTAITPEGETFSRIAGHAERLRDCAFVRLEWYFGTFRNNSLVVVTFEEGARRRPIGEMPFGPWLVQLTPDQLTRRSHAVVFHRCHALWLTETEFFASTTR